MTLTYIVFKKWYLFAPNCISLWVRFLSISNHLSFIKPRGLGTTNVIPVIINVSETKRLCIGHTRVTHWHLLTGDSQPLCDECKSFLTVKHILLDCCSLKHVREKYFTCSSLKQLFKNVDATTIMDFSKKIIFIILCCPCCSCFCFTLAIGALFLLTVLDHSLLPSCICCSI